MESKGFRVRIVLANGTTQIMRNVTEIHSNYQSVPGVPSEKIAFESDIHATGQTPPKTSVLEFEALLETEIAEEPYEESTDGQ